LKILPGILIFVGFVMFVFGPKLAALQIPADRRARMADFDWIGVEWIAGGVLMMIAGLAGWLITRNAGVVNRD